MSLSERLRPGVECAQWVIDEVIAMEQALVELSASYQRVLAEREELYRKINGTAGKTQHCPMCRRSLPLENFDKSERPTRQGVVYVCRACEANRRPPCSAHGEEA